MKVKDLYFNHRPTRGRRPNTKFPNQSQISPTASYWRSAATATVEEGEKKKWADPFTEFYMAGRPGSRGEGGIKTDEVKPPVGKRQSNIMKGRETSI